MAYNKEQVQAVADAIYDAIQAARDGIGVDDTAAAITLFTAFAGAADEFQTDTDAAGLHLAARLADRFGDSRIDAPEEG